MRAGSESCSFRCIDHVPLIFKNNGDGKTMGKTMGTGYDIVTL
jgi:hypothetical protein